MATRGADVETTDVVTIELSSPKVMSPGVAFPHPSKRKQGKGRGSGCRCNRRQCTLKRISGSGQAVDWCGVHEALVKGCFFDAHISGEAVVRVRTDDQGAVKQAYVYADDRVVECIHRETVQAAFPHRPAAAFQILFRYQWAPP
jgi:hypothetical protein